MHLKELVKRGVAMKMVSYKMPSHIHKVKYKKAIDRLLETNISDDENDEIENKKKSKNYFEYHMGLDGKGFSHKNCEQDV